MRYLLNRCSECESINGFTLGVGRCAVCRTNEIPSGLRICPDCQVERDLCGVCGDLVLPTCKGCGIKVPVKQDWCSPVGCIGLGKNA